MSNLNMSIVTNVFIYLYTGKQKTKGTKFCSHVKNMLPIRPPCVTY